MKKINLETFINRANLIYLGFYDYSISKYNGMKNTLEIKCKKHGTFQQTPDSHLHGHGCPECGKEKNSQKFIKLKSDFINEANILHKNRYNYSSVNYIGARNKIQILCNKHGVFMQTPDSHLRGRGCPKCVNRNCTTMEFIEKANFVHDYSYSYEQTNYINPKSKITICCSKHGEFTQTPNSHLNGSGCPVCKSSKGELCVIKFLKLNNIEYIRQKKFKNCKHKHLLPFDFYLPQHNILVEYDGEQHSRPINFFGISSDIAELNFQKLKLCDEIKSKYAMDNNIYLIRISHNIKNIEQFLKNNLNYLNKS